MCLISPLHRPVGACTDSWSDTLVLHLLSQINYSFATNLFHSRYFDLVQKKKQVHFGEFTKFLF